MKPSAGPCFIKNNKVGLYISISFQTGNACLPLNALI